MKLGIVELDHHAECLNSLCQLLAQSSFEVTVFTTQKLANEFKNADYFNKYSWVEANGDVSYYLKTNLATLEAQDLLFFSTIESNFKAFNDLELKVKKMIRVHNANTFLAIKKAWFFKPSFYWLYKDFSYWIRKAWFENEIEQRKIFVKNAQIICFTCDEITEHIISQSNFLYKEKIVNAVPITFNDYDPKPPELKLTVFAIVGTIDRKRKNYLEFLQALKALRIGDDESIEVKLMGKPKGRFGKKIVDQFKLLSSPKVKISSWDTGLSQQEFDQQMLEVDVIVAPILEETKYFLVKEIYGQTKISGSINDCIKYGKIGIIPSFYLLTENKEPLFKRYNNIAELTDVLQKFISGAYSSHLKKSSFKDFNLTYNQNKLTTLLTKLIQN